MTTLAPINRTLLRIIWAHMAGRVAYEEGVKAPSLDCDTHAIYRIDCSGFARYAIARATAGRLVLPDGSVTQHEWADAHGLPRQDYKTDACRCDNQIRIAFLSPARAAAVGREGDRHVWLVMNGWTMESHGDGGCIARPWNTWILHQSDACYLLPSIAG